MVANSPTPDYLIYTRLSAEEAIRGGMSLDMQEARCRECAAAGGLPVSEVFSDYGFSGKTMRRPGFEEMRERLLDARGVIVWKLDRLSRRVRDIYGFLEWCREQGKDFISVHERFDTTTATGRGFLGVAAVFAQLEAEQVAERTREGNRHRASRGIWLYQAPFGYDYSTQTKLLTPGVRAGDCVTVFRWFVEAVGNYHATARRLNEGRVVSPKGGGWSAQGVKDVVTNPVYRGKIQYADILGEGNWESIIPADLLAEADRLIEALRHAPKGRTNLARHPFSGRLACHECGAPVIIQLRKASGAMVLRCRAARHSMGCSQPGFAGKRLEELWLFGLEKAWAEEPVDLAAVDLDGLAESQGWVSLEERERRKAALEAKRRRIIDLRIEGHIEKDEMDRRLVPLAEEMAQLEHAAPEGDEQVAALDDLLREGLAPTIAWGGMTAAEQRRLVSALLRAPLEVEVDAERHLRVHANTWLYAQRWEAWERFQGLSRKHSSSQNGRLAYAVRALD